MSLKESTRRLRKDYVEARAGSPTPPSTPGQLSPESRSCGEQSLSVDITHSLASPSGQYFSVQDRRSVLNGLLQIAEQTDNQSSCSGSPLSTTVTSNGMVTCEEVMGDMVERDRGLHTPSGKVVSRSNSKESAYYGSLKKVE